jgi:hypothetical protein
MSDHVEKFVRSAVQSFIGDPPDSDFNAATWAQCWQSQTMRSDFQCRLLHTLKPRNCGTTMSSTGPSVIRTRRQREDRGHDQEARLCWYREETEKPSSF